MTTTSTPSSVSGPSSAPAYKLIWWAAIIAACVFIVILTLSFTLFAPRNTVVSQSPDGSHQVVVREGIRTIDRNFRVVLVDLATGAQREIFVSDDQSPSIDRERFVWSDDSKKVALLGDKYYVVSDSSLSNGEIVFLVYDLENDRLWCNTDHDRGMEAIPAAQAADMFGEALTR